MFRKEFGKAKVTSLVERASRFAVVLKIPDRNPNPSWWAGSTAHLPCPNVKDGLGIEP
jgi:hypothetical protein